MVGPQPEMQLDWQLSGFCGFLQDDSEQALVVEAPWIRTERLGFANHGLMAGKALREGPEAPVRIDVINHQGAAWFEGCPSAIQLEAYIAFTMHAIVNEKIDPAKLRKQLG
jgi:hypothetical protein